MVGTLISVLLGVIIFSYAGYTLYKNIKLQSKGKCVGCSSDCSSCNISEIYPMEDKKL